MNKEEIETIKEMIKERQEEINGCEEWVNTGLEEEELQALQSALDYIDKLQKEIDTEKGYHSELQLRYNIEHDVNQKLRQENEELKEENKKLKKENEALEIIHETYKEVVDNGEFISKDKIKDKITEYCLKAIHIESINIARNTTKEEKEKIKLYRNIVDILEELLEE